MTAPTFSSFLLDPQLLTAIPWESPLPVQCQVIPHALTGKSIAVKSKTGSGKTAAFLLPTIHRILSGHCSRALILAPTRELCYQLQSVARNLTKNMNGITTDNIALNNSDQSYRSNASIVVATTGSVQGLIKNNQLFDILIIDEADLCAALNPLKDITKLVKATNPQIMFISATLDDNCINMLRKRFDASLRLVHVCQKENLPDSLCQFWIDCTNSDSTTCSNDEEKFVLLIALIKLNLIYPGPILIFTSSVNRSYRIRLVLEQFGIAACSLNAELPQESKQHILERFQQGLHDVLITTDCADVSPRGIDFRPVNFVVNFDLPDTCTAYIHRVGRAARLERNGTAISLVGPDDQSNLDSLIEQLLGSSMKAYPFPQEQVEGFRYRVREAMRISNKLAIKQARIKELKQEILNSNKLKAYFAHHERDYELLCTHGMSFLNSKISKRFKNIPKYILTKNPRSSGEQNNPSSVVVSKSRKPRKHGFTPNIKNAAKSVNVLKSAVKGAKLLKNY
ncbi:hypothetical protein GJ496_005273 [Pomphorhynchus laevis]|nr:hypothetical protein GJ496_005273 [Pomphorhynchus laevis]